MRLVAVWVLSLFAATAMADSPEIQMFLNYKGPSTDGRNHYEQKIVSTPGLPDSAYFVYVDRLGDPTTAACYWGEPGAAFQLFREMVRIFNAEYHHNVRVRAELVEDPASRYPALRIDADEDGVVYPWFKRMGRCWRESTFAERHPAN